MQEGAAEVRLLVCTEPAIAREVELRDSNPPAAFTNDTGFHLAHELRLIVASLTHQSLCSLRTMVVGGRYHMGATMSSATASGGSCSPEQLSARASELRAWKQRLNEHVQQSLAANYDADSWQPRLVRVASAYQLSARERDALILLLIVQGHQTDTFGVCFEDVEEGAIDGRLLRALCGMDAVETALFFEEERALVKEGIVQQSHPLSLGLTHTLRPKHPRPSAFAKPTLHRGACCAGLGS